MNQPKASRVGRYLPIVLAILVLAIAACVCTGGGATNPTPVAGTTTGGTTDGSATIAPTNAPSDTTTGGTTTGGTTTGGTTDGGTTTGSSTDTNLEIVNNTDVSICYVYIASSTDDTDWGNEVLGEGVVIASGATDVVSGPPGVYDIILEDCDHNVVAWNYGADLSSDITLTVSGSPDTLTILNNSTFDFCGIYLKTPNTTDWGRSHLNPEHPIYAGETRVFAVTAGAWDLRAETCDGQEVERLGEELGGDYEWEFFNE